MRNAGRSVRRPVPPLARSRLESVAVEDVLGRFGGVARNSARRLHDDSARRSCVVARAPDVRAATTCPLWDAVCTRHGRQSWHPALTRLQLANFTVLLKTVELMQTFPYDESIARLRALPV